MNTITLKYHTINLQKLIVNILILLCFTGFLRAQNNEDITKYSNIANIQLNSISNNKALYPFYEKLFKLEKNKENKISIVHIGDSHLQADFLSQKVRIFFQNTFGNAGRGLIFPYRLAKTSGQSGFSSFSPALWDNSKIIYRNRKLPIGISGITIKTEDSSAFLKIKVFNEENLDNSFDKIILFHEKSPQAYNFIISDTSNQQIGYINSQLNTDTSGNKYISTAILNKPVNEFYLYAINSDTTQHFAQIYGFLLEKSNSKGITYNTIGVNGAEYKSYNHSEHFIEQLSTLSPQLIIISLGTNEAYSGYFSEESFMNEIDKLVESIKCSNPDAALLLTTPPDSNKKRKFDNPKLKLIRSDIINYCNRNDLAYWDLYSIMGGPGSMNKWHLKRLTAPDCIHFNKKGYSIIGELLSNALKDSFENYEHNRPQ
ncbi:MAG: GDSL-type esterase/lipase family protein [Bacteroidota bacterium]|nr:GDSL-type esterase/lipase family protein [Bacteroidota bacterium]